jgi:hypothetical protein
VSGTVAHAKILLSGSLGFVGSIRQDATTHTEPCFWFGDAPTLLPYNFGLEVRPTDLAIFDRHSVIVGAYTSRSGAQIACQWIDDGTMEKMPGGDTFLPAFVAANP